MMIARTAGLLAGILLVAGCGGGTNKELIPVTGKVTLDGKAAPHSLVTFSPVGDTKGNGGSGKADAEGRYEAMTPQGHKGLHPGKYKVVISRRLHPDGSPMRPDEMPIESQARETLPPRWSSPETTVLTAEVSADKATADFDLKTKK